MYIFRFTFISHWSVFLNKYTELNNNNYSFKMASMPRKYLETLHSLGGEDALAGDDEMRRLMQQIQEYQESRDKFTNSFSNVSFRLWVYVHSLGWRGTAGLVKSMLSSPHFVMLILTAVSVAASYILYDGLWRRFDTYGVVAKGSVRRLRWLLRCSRFRPAGRRVGLEERDGRGRTALHLAAGRSAAMTQALLKAGADPSARDFSGNTALHYAMKLQPTTTAVNQASTASLAGGGELIPSELGKSGGGSGNCGGGAPLFGSGPPMLPSELEDLAAQLQEELAAASAALAAADGTATAGGGDGTTGKLASAWARLASSICAYFAVQPEQPSVVRLLLAAGCDPAAVNAQGHSPLHVAAGEPRADPVFLVALGQLLHALAAKTTVAITAADVSGCAHSTSTTDTKDATTPAPGGEAEAAAAEAGSATAKVAGGQKSKKGSKKGGKGEKANVTSSAEEGLGGSTSTGTAGAAANDVTTVASTSTSSKVDGLWAAVTHGDTSGATPLHYVSRPEVLAAILSRLSGSSSGGGGGGGSNCACTSDSSAAPASVAAAAAAALAVADHSGLTPLMAACRDGRSKVVGAMIVAGADASAMEPRSGWTAGHYACTNGRSSGEAAAEAIRALQDGQANLTDTLPAPVDAHWFTWGFSDPVAYAARREGAVGEMVKAACGASSNAIVPRAFPIPGAPRQLPLARFPGCTSLGIAAASIPTRSLTPLLKALRKIGIDVNQREDHGATPAGVVSLYAERSWHGHSSGLLGGQKVDKLQSQLHQCALTDNGDAITAWIRRPKDMLRQLIEAEREVRAAEAQSKQPGFTLNACPVTGRTSGATGSAGISGCPFASRMAAIAREKERDKARADAIAATIGLKAPPPSLADALPALPPGHPPLPTAAAASAATSSGGTGSASSSASSASAEDPTPVAAAHNSDGAAEMTSGGGDAVTSAQAVATPAALALPAVPPPSPSPSPPPPPPPLPSQSLLRSVCLSLSRKDIDSLLASMDPSIMLQSLDHLGMTPLHTAGWLGHLTSVKALIEGGADLDCRGVGPLQLPPLGAVFLRFQTHWAEIDDEGKSGYARLFACAEALLTTGASLSRCLVGLHPAKGSNGNVTLVLPPHVKLWAEHPSFLRALLRAAASDCSSVDDYGCSMLHVLLYAGLPKTAGSAIRLLINRMEQDDEDAGDMDDDDDDVSTAVKRKEATLRAFLCSRNTLGHSVLSLLETSGVPSLVELASSPALGRLKAGQQAAYATAFPLHAAARDGDVSGLTSHLCRIAAGLADGRDKFTRLRQQLDGLHKRKATPAVAMTSGGADGCDDATSPFSSSSSSASLAGEASRISREMRSLVFNQQRLVGETEQHDDAGRTVLAVACWFGQTEVVRLLVTGQAPPPTATSAEADVISGASGAKPPSAPGADRLPRASVEARSAVFSHGHLLTQRPLAIAAARNWPEVVTVLLDAGASPLAPSDAAVPDRMCYRESISQTQQQQQQVIKEGGNTGANSTGPTAEKAASAAAACAGGCASGVGKKTSGGGGGKKGKKGGGNKGGSAASASAASPVLISPASSSVGSGSGSSAVSGSPSPSSIITTPPPQTYVKASLDAISAAGLAGSAEVMRVLLSHRALSDDFDDVSGGGMLGPYSQSFGWAAAYAARAAADSAPHAETAALLLPLTGSDPSSFVFPASVPGRGIRVGPASYASGDVREAVMRALEGATTGTGAKPTEAGSKIASGANKKTDDDAAVGGNAGSNNSSSSSSEEPALTEAAPSPAAAAPQTSVVLSPPQARWMLKQAHRTLLGYALADDDALRLGAWLRHPIVRNAVDGLTLASAIRIGSPQVAAALTLHHGLPFNADSHKQLILLTGCDVRKFAAIGSVKQVCQSASRILCPSDTNIEHFNDFIRYFLLA